MNTVLAPVAIDDASLVGLHPDLAIEAYHGGRGISKSGLDHIARSAATYWALHLDPRRPAPRDRPGQLEGSLAHCALLEPDQFDTRYRVRQFDGRTKEGKVELAAVAARGQTLITSQQRAVAMAQARSMASLSVLRDALAGELVAEQSAYAVDRATGALVRCRPDLAYRVPRGVILMDVKTFKSAAPDEFSRQVARKRYHVQDAFYRDVYSWAADVDVLGFVFIAVETEYPYLAHSLMLDDESVETGRRAYRRDLNTYVDCLARDAWPGYGDEISLISLPRWLTRKEELE